MDEIWKDIIDYENYYQISNYGNVKSLCRIVSGNQQNPFRKISEKILKPGVDGMDYKRVNLLKDGKQTSFTIHFLIAKHFVENENNLNEINHIDGNKLNNSINNLEWCTHKNNMKHARDNNLIKNLKRRKVLQYDKNNKLLNSYDSIIEASIKNNIGKSLIGRCCRKIRQSAGGYIWKYNLE